MLGINIEPRIEMEDGPFWDLDVDDPDQDEPFCDDPNLQADRPQGENTPHCLDNDPDGFDNPDNPDDFEYTVQVHGWWFSTGLLERQEGFEKMSYYCEGSPVVPRYHHEDTGGPFFMSTHKPGRTPRK